MRRCYLRNYFNWARGRQEFVRLKHVAFPCGRCGGSGVYGAGENWYFRFGKPPACFECGGYGDRFFFASPAMTFYGAGLAKGKEVV